MSPTNNLPLPPSVADLPDELSDQGADAIMSVVLEISGFLQGNGIPPPLGPIALRAWLLMWEMQGEDPDKTVDAVSKLIHDEWRKEVTALKKRAMN